jgi:hypothetical protein
LLNLLKAGEGRGPTLATLATLAGRPDEIHNPGATPAEAGKASLAGKQVSEVFLPVHLLHDCTGEATILARADEVIE